MVAITYPVAVKIATIHQPFFIKDSGRLHNSDAIMSTMASQITSLTIFTQPLIQAQIKENTEAPRHWPLWGEFIGDRWVPRTKGQ